jgi:hypothetical protein
MYYGVKLKLLYVNQEAELEIYTLGENVKTTLYHRQ